MIRKILVHNHDDQFSPAISNINDKILKLFQATKKESGKSTLIFFNVHGIHFQKKFSFIELLKKVR